MAYVAIIENTGELKAYLETVSLKPGESCQCLALESPTEEIQKLLSAKKIEEISFSFNSNERERFLKEYVDFVGALDVNQDNLLWWATDISSKNRFTSGLAFLLQQFWLTKEKIKRKDYNRLVIAGAPWVLTSSLRKVLRHESIPCTIIERGYGRLLEMITGTLKRWVSVLTNLAIFSIRKIYQSLIYGRRPAKKKYYVIKTFLYNHSITSDGRMEDAFFGPLPAFLAGKTDVLILANILGNYRHCIQKIKSCREFEIFPLESFVSLWDIVFSFIRILFYKADIKGEVPFFGDSAADIVQHELRRTHYKIHPFQFLHYRCVKNLSKEVSIETFLLTHESNPWEKMCMLALKDHSPLTKTIGYQHAVIPQASANMFMSRLEEKVCPRPGKILTVGEKPCAIIKKYSAHPVGSIEPGCGLKFGYLFSMREEPREKTGRILLALEGIFNSYKVVNYVMEELKDKSDYQVTIRTHPVMPVKSFRHKLTLDPGVLSNFQISKNRPLKEDLANHDIVIYWGSTVALEAVLTGKPVIHFDNGSILSYDPLFECPYFKRIISPRHSLASVLEEIYHLSDKDFADECKKARAYIKEYFYPVNEPNLAKFLPA